MRMTVTADDRRDLGGVVEVLRSEQVEVVIRSAHRILPIHCAVGQATRTCSITRCSRSSTAVGDCKPSGSSRVSMAKVCIEVLPLGELLDKPKHSPLRSIRKACRTVTR